MWLTVQDVYCADLSSEDSEQYSAIWDKYLLKLNDFTLAALGKRTMFEHVFHSIHLIMCTSSTSEGLKGCLCKVFIEDPVLEVQRQPHNFMKKIFIPVASAMDRIFNWQGIVLPGSTEIQ